MAERETTVGPASASSGLLCERATEATVYYQSERVTLYHGDCLNVLPTLSRECADVVLTDPPFFMPAVHYSSRTEWQRSWGDTSILSAFWSNCLDAMVPVLKRTGHLLAFCDGDSYPVFYPQTYRRFDSLRSLVWNKGSIGMGSPWRNQHELILAARWSGSYRSEHRGCPDVIEHGTINAAKRVHPVDKPIGLLAELLLPIAPADALIVDPFAGGGSTLLAALTSGHRAIGVESEERYCEIAARRIEAAESQHSLFPAT